jgi:hypothetical protein
MLKLVECFPSRRYLDLYTFSIKVRTCYLFFKAQFLTGRCGLLWLASSLGGDCLGSMSSKSALKDRQSKMIHSQAEAAQREEKDGLVKLHADD